MCHLTGQMMSTTWIILLNEPKNKQKTNLTPNKPWAPISFSLVKLPSASMLILLKAHCSSMHIYSVFNYVFQRHLAVVRFPILPTTKWKLIGHVRQRPEWRRLELGQAQAVKSSAVQLRRKVAASESLSLRSLSLFFSIPHSECSKGETLKQTPKPERSARGFPPSPLRAQTSLLSWPWSLWCLPRQRALPKTLICFSSHEPCDSGLRLLVAEGTWLAESAGWAHFYFVSLHPFALLPRRGAPRSPSLRLMLFFSARTFDQGRRAWKGWWGGGVGGVGELAVGSAITPTQEGARKKGMESLFPLRRLLSDTVSADGAERQFNELFSAATQRRRSMASSFAPQWRSLGGKKK